MKTMASLLTSKNKIAVIITLILFSLMLVNNRLFQYLLVFTIIFVAYDRMLKFIPYRFSHEDLNSEYNFFKLLPIKDKEMQKVNIINALIWSIFIFVAILWLYAASFNGLSGQVIVLSGLAAFIIPLCLSFYEYSRQFLAEESWHFSCLIACISVFAIGLSNSELSKITTLGLVGRLSVIICLTLALIWVRNKFSYTLNGQGYRFTNIRMLRLYRTSRFYFSKLNVVPEVFYVYVLYFCVKGELVIVGIYAILVSLFLAFVNVESFFSHVSLIDLLPISTNEKKLTCNIMSLVALLGCNGLITLIIFMFNRDKWSEILSFYLALISMSILAYSFYVTYYHRGKNWVLLCGLPIIYVVIAFVSYHYFKLMGNIVFVPIVLVSLILLVLDYHHGSDVPTLI